MQFTCDECSIRQHTSAYVGRMQHTSGCVSIRQLPNAVHLRHRSIRQHTSAYVGRMQHTSACVSIRMQFIGAIAEDMCKITLPRLSMLYSLLTCCTTDAHDTCDIAEDMCKITLPRA